MRWLRNLFGLELHITDKLKNYNISYDPRTVKLRDVSRVNETTIYELYYSNLRLQVVFKGNKLTEIYLFIDGEMEPSPFSIRIPPHKLIINKWNDTFNRVNKLKLLMDKI